MGRLASVALRVVGLCLLIAGTIVVGVYTDMGEGAPTSLVVLGSLSIIIGIFVLISFGPAGVVLGLCGTGTFTALWGALAWAEELADGSPTDWARALTTVGIVVLCAGLLAWVAFRRSRAQDGPATSPEVGREAAPKSPPYQPPDSPGLSPGPGAGQGASADVISSASPKPALRPRPSSGQPVVAQYEDPALWRPTLPRVVESVVAGLVVSGVSAALGRVFG